jgi:hypothetical protein
MVAEPDISMLALDCSSANMVKKWRIEKVLNGNAANSI